MQRLDVQLLGGFRVEVDARAVGDDAWPHGRARQLVKLLALTPEHRLDRDRVIEALWPHLEPEAGAANLHKAASYARRALRDRDAVVLRKGSVELAPKADVSTDVERFEAGEDGAYRGELLPDDLYEDWTAEARERLRAAHAAASQEQGRWEEAIAAEPTNEEAARAAMRARAEAGDRAGAVRQFRQLRERLAELGLAPEQATVDLFAELSRGPAVQVDAGGGPGLVGRDKELRIVEKALERAEAGRGGVLALGGDPGIGKTRLAETTLAEASERGWHTLRGAARPGEALTPYGPALEALEPLLTRRGDLLTQLSDETGETLAAVAPSRRGIHDESSASLSRQEVLASVGDLVTAAARERGVALLLDDVHAADEATLRLAGYLAQSARSLRLLIVLCLRSGEEPDDVVALRRQFAEQRIAVDLNLGPLDPVSVRSIAQEVTGGELPPATVAAIERSSAGNPFFVEELAATTDAGGEVTVPDHLNEIVASRLDTLDSAAAELLPYLAVLEEPFAVEEVAALARGSEERTATALRAASASGVLRPAGDEAFSFRHPLVREACRARIPDGQLAEAHAEAASRLMATGAPPERIAHHLLRAGRETEAVPMLREAAEWAMGVAAYGEGLRWAEDALRHAEAEQRPELIELVAELRDRTGDPHAPLAYEDAVRVAAPERRLGLRVKQARAYLATNDVEAASRIVDRLDTDGAEIDDRARATLTRGLVAWSKGEIGEARSCANEAADLCEAAELPEEATELEDLAAMVAHADGQWGPHVHWRLDETSKFPEVAGRVYDAYLCVTEYVMQAGEPYDELREFAHELRVHAQRAGARRGEAYATTILGEAELLSGNPEVAKEHLAEAARLSRRVRAAGCEAIARARLGEAMLHLGDRQGAAAQIEEALGLAYHSSLAPHLLPIVHGLAVSVPTGPSVAMELVDRAESILDEQSMCQFCRVAFYVAAAGACGRSREVVRGERFVAKAEETSGQWKGWTPWSAAIAEARGELLIAEGRRDEAAADLRRAVEGFAAAGQGLNESRAREALTALSQ